MTHIENDDNITKGLETEMSRWYRMDYSRFKDYINQMDYEKLTRFNQLYQSSIYPVQSIF